jgi:hypothetical protein
MHRHKRLFDQVASLNNLLAAARDALRGKRSREPGASFYADLEQQVVDLHTELSSDSYLPGDYHYFRIHEPKERLVAAAPFRDRVVHHAIVRVIQPLFERRFIEDSFASRPGKGTHAAMRRAVQFARRFQYALKCDVEKYFPSIDHGVLMSLVGRVIGDRRLLALIGKILDSHHDGMRQVWPAGGALLDVEIHKCGLPIGNLTSQFLANVYLDTLDQFVKHDLRVKGYVRYLDDFLLFGDDRRRLKEHGRQVQEKLAELHLRMHPDKYRLLPTRCGVDFVGFVVWADGRIRVRTATARRFHQRFRVMRWEVKQRRRSAASVTTSVCAWVAHVKHAQSVGLRRAVLSR